MNSTEQVNNNLSLCSSSFSKHIPHQLFKLKALQTKRNPLLNQPLLLISNFVSCSCHLPRDSVHVIIPLLNSRFHEDLLILLSEQPTNCGTWLSLYRVCAKLKEWENERMNPGYQHLKNSVIFNSSFHYSTNQHGGQASWVLLQYSFSLPFLSDCNFFGGLKF